MIGATIDNILSVEEKKLLLAFSKVEGDSIWQIAIKNVCTNPSAYRFRKLVCELKSQAADCETTMRNILGDGLLDQLLAL